MRYLHVQFSAGVHPARLGDFLPEAVSYWLEFASYDKAFDDSPAAMGRRVPHIDLHDTDYWNAIRLTSFAILLGHTGLLPQIAALWDYENDDMDGLLERLVAPFVPSRAAPPDTCTRHLPYFKLLKVFSADASQRPALMARYMDEWYTASRREPYYDSHTKGRDHSFLGYWSFEAAAVAYVLDIEDESFRDHEFYPKDLADFARSLPRPVVLGGDSSGGATTPERLHCPAGLPCPRTGFWFSPARPDSRRRFDAGETMPDLGGDYGTTIWQWDERQ
ncbi:PoNe immunity protein domain-containing protein [Aquabacterium humicola]|uniref:PoNe immunity protein domain-containing protein n=1 Tax=Aquabacterium humicola TaxID=3237377 RepID=UPI002543A399|nr:PoNe immunity protein domain-containing protein [Rubrivivax pictus]